MRSKWEKLCNVLHSTILKFISYSYQNRRATPILSSIHSKKVISFPCTKQPLTTLTKQKGGHRVNARQYGPSSRRSPDEKMINYMLVKNSLGNVIFSRYYKHFDMEKKYSYKMKLSVCVHQELETSTIVDYEDYTVVFQKFSAVTFIAGITQDENELAVFELFRHFCETLIKYLGSLTGLHFVTNLDKVHMVLDEMILNGHICETSQARILAPLQLMTTAKR